MERVSWGRMQNPIRGLLHGSAAVAALVGLVLLIRRAWGDLTALFSASIFGLALLVMYVVSTLYHSVPWSPSWKRRLQRLDHAVIYLVVAGTFTPIAVAALDGRTRTVALVAVWAMATTGIALKLALPGVTTWLSITLQLTMGWAALLWLPQIHQRLGTTAIVLIALGGLCYTAGAVAFILKRPRLLPRTFSYHEFFHVLVIAASLLHFLVVFDYAIPVTGG